MQDVASGQILKRVKRIQDGNSKAVKTPMAANFYDLHRENKNESIVQGQKYRNMIESLLALSNRARPNIGTSLTIPGRYLT